ncbi:MAG: alkaline phosphatase PhoX [Bacteroidota bacterium]
MKNEYTSFFKKRGIPAFMLAAMLFSGIAVKAQTTTVTSKISQATDDMEEIIATGAIDFDSSDLEMTTEGAGVQILGFRFANLNIPAGAVITSAYIQFRADETNTEATTLIFRGEVANNSATFANVAFTVSSRPLTTASASWSPASWSVIDERGAAQKSTNIKNVVQEIVSRSGWAANNALTIIITGSGKRVADSYEGSAANAAELTVEYVMPTVVSSRVNNGNDDAEENITSGAIDLTSSDLELTEDGSAQHIAMRFTSLNIPKTAIITNAYIQFAVDETNSGVTNLTLRGEAADNPVTYSATTNNISSRPITTANVIWSPAPWTTLQQMGADQRTPNLAAIVQEIVDRSGWNAFNSMAIRISGTGKRVAESFNVSATRAPQLVVEYYTLVRPQPPVGTFPVAKNSLWKYFDKGTDPGANWKDVNFNDSLWNFGPAELGYGDGGEATTVDFGTDANNKFPATYFRHTFDVSSLPNIDSLIIGLMRDDGAVVYLNGTEIVRSNMPAGVITYQTYASATVDGTNESAYFNFTANENLLVAGKNVLAVEIHQDRASSSDISFNLELKGKKNDVKLITAGTEWKYYDNGGFADAGWTLPDFSDVIWNKGKAPLGYGNGDEATTIGFGSNAAFKNITSYFRKSFTVGDTSGFKTLVLRLKRDDGAVIYLNGTELIRNNMPGGTLTNQTLAGSYIEGAEENEFIAYYIDKSVLKTGLNIIAAEIHQNSPTSTDTRFDLDLTLVEETFTLSSLASNITCVGGDKIGCFTSVTPTPQQQTFNYPKGTHTFQVIMKSQRDRYTGSSELIPNGNDFTGFIPQNMSSVAGTVSVNHENNPGGVSLISVNYDAATALWKVPQIRKVDFTQIVKTERNCSGGVTPWGTVITSEETYSTGDVNADGYHDIGWNVEIDPATGRIRDYNGDGKPDKLWAVGRMSHENVVVAKDSVTLYQGEDGGTGCVYKFVAASKMRLDSGALYVLKRDSATATTGTWVRVPNTTQSDRNTTSTIAAPLGGYRFGGVEDVEINPVTGMIYFTEKGRGETWRFKDNGMTLSNLEVILSNRTYPIIHETGVTNESWQTGNDNLDFDGEGNLYVLQDGGRDHIWVVRPEHTQANPKVELFATSPTGSEPTGITFSPDYRFMFLSFQNSSSTNTASQIDAANNPIVHNASATIVVARKEHLGAGAIAPKVELGADITACEGTFLQLKYENKDAQNIWSDNSTGNMLNVTKSGLYTLTVVGNNGKISRDSIRVTLLPRPVVELGPTQTICEGKTAVLKAPEGFKTYIWSDGASGPVREVKTAGKYSVIVYNESGCTMTDTVSVIVTPSPQPALENTAAICKGGPTVLNAGAGFVSYQWNTGATTPTLTVSQAGVYSVKLMNAEGCEYNEAVTVTMSPEVTLGADKSICEGGKTVLKPNFVDFAQYEWNTGSKAVSIEAAQPGMYFVKMTTREGCVSYDSVTVSLTQLSELNLGSDTTICADCSITLDAGAGFSSYKWNTGATTRTITVTTAGKYSVIAANDGGCTTSDEIAVAVLQPTGISELDENSTISVFPNPFTSQITLNLTLLKEENVTVELFEASGKKVGVLMNKLVSAGTQPQVFSTVGMNLTSGVYMIKVNVGGREFYEKLIKE